MSDSEIAILRNEIKSLSEKTDRQHAENQRNQQRDRDTFRDALAAQQKTFADAMDAQREAFQDALNRQFLSHITLDKTVDRHGTLIENIIGDGQPGEGRVGVLEEAMDTMKKFRWQVAAILAVVTMLVELWRSGGH